VAHEVVPTIDNVMAIANHGPTATLFTLGRNHTVQQYDLNTQNIPVMVKDIQHVPANAPPTPPDSVEERTRATMAPAVVKSQPEMAIHVDTEISHKDGQTRSPLQKIAQEMDHLEDERRDRVTPLSPASSRNSQSSSSSYGARRGHARVRDPVKSPALSHKTGSDTTAFSGTSSGRSGHESISIRSMSSTNSSKYQSSSLRNVTLRSPEGVNQMAHIDLFPFVKARLSEVRFRTPHYGQVDLTSNVLRQEMLSIIFGWDHDIESLIRDEQSRHNPGSASSVLLSKWLGDIGADALAQMVGSESMTSSDWMLLALSCSMGQGSQKQVGEAFVRRLLETDDIHPAVAILLGLGEQNEAVEVYVSRKYFLEAVLLTCLLFPEDWQRQSYLVRKWGEAAVSAGAPELAVRCFSCTTIQSSEPWFSPRARDAVYDAQQQILGPNTASPPSSPPSAGSSSIPNRMTAKKAGLKLTTDFGGKETPNSTRNTGLGVTPIADSALSPGAEGPWVRSSNRNPSSARTATPGAYRTKRLPSARGR